MGRATVAPQATLEAILVLAVAGGCAGASRGVVDALTPDTAERVRQAARAPDRVRCDVLAADLAAAERLSAAAASVLARSLALHDGDVVRWATPRAPIRVWVARPAWVASPDVLARAARGAARDWNGAAAGLRLGR